MCKLNESDLLNKSVVISRQEENKHEHRRVHYLNLSELAVLSDEKAASNIVIRRKGGGLT